MYVIKRKNKDGTTTYRIRYRDENGELTDVKQEYLLNRFGKKPQSDTDADEMIKILKSDFEKNRMLAIEQLELKSEYFDPNEMFNYYVMRQEKNASESFRNNAVCVYYYVYPFFFNVIKETNPAMWPHLGDKFKDWLENEAMLVKFRGKDMHLSYAYINHCIKAYNTFLSAMYERKIISGFQKLAAFPRHMCNKRSVDDLIFPKEIDLLESYFIKNKMEDEALFLRLLYETGMRFNELRGLSLENINKFSHDEYTKNIVKVYDLGKVYGTLNFYNQPVKSVMLRKDGEFHTTRNSSNSSGIKQVILRKAKYLPHQEGNNVDNTVIKRRVVIKDETNKLLVDRKPLKGRKTQDPIGDARTIPIFNGELWQRIGQRVFELLQERKSKLYGENSLDYLFFPKIIHSSFFEKLKTAYKECNIPFRSAHCCRHSFVTFLLMKVKDRQYVRLLTGHKSELVFQEYDHLIALINSKKQKIDTLDISSFREKGVLNEEDFMKEWQTLSDES